MCGNQLVSTIAYNEYSVDGSLNEVDAEIDGVRQKIKVGSIVPVKKAFNILPIDGYRVNTIGYVNKERDDESNVTITANDIHRRFSIDQDAKTYRVEFYNEDKFCGMVQVKFEDEEQNIVTASGTLRLYSRSSIMAFKIMARSLSLKLSAQHFSRGVTRAVRRP